MDGLSKAMAARKKEVAARRTSLQKISSYRPKTKIKAEQFNCRLAEDDLATIDLLGMEMSMNRTDVVRFLIQQARGAIEKRKGARR